MREYSYGGTVIVYSELICESPPLIGTQTYSYTYQIDALNRVTSITSITYGVVDQNYEFAYY
jgi:hypothetical protein